jgi:hypothetical protein
MVGGWRIWVTLLALEKYLNGKPLTKTEIGLLDGLVKEASRLPEMKSVNHLPKLQMSTHH